MELTLENVKANNFIKPAEYLLDSHHWKPEKTRIGHGFKVGTKITEDVINQIVTLMESNHGLFLDWITNKAVEVVYGKECNSIPLSDKLAEFLLKHLQAEKALSEAEAEFEAALNKAMAICDKHDLSFDICPAYGMGGVYHGSTGEWSPSSQSC